MTASSGRDGAAGGALELDLVARDLPLVCLVVGPDGTVRAANRYTARLCGFDPTGHPLAELLFEGQRAALPRLLAQARLHRTLLSFETGERLPRSAAVAALPHPDGLLLLGSEDRNEQRQVEQELTRVNGELATVTRELQKANVALARSGEAKAQALEDTSRRLDATEGWLRRVVEGAGAGLWEWDLLAHRTTFSPEWLSLHGLGPGPGPDTPEALAARLDPRAFDALRVAIQTAQEDVAPEVRAEYRVRGPGPGAAWRWLLSIGRVERGPGDRPAQVLGVTLDVTERKLAERELAASELKFRSIFLNSMDGVTLGTPGGAIVAANPAACAIFGRSEFEVRRLGRSAIVVQGEALSAALAERERTGRVRAELQIRRPDGSLVDVEMASCAFDVPGGAPMVVTLFRVLAPGAAPSAAAGSGDSRATGLGAP